MKRFLIFTTLYPPLVLLCVLLLVREARSPADVSFMFWMLGIAYLIGIGPSLVSAAVDWAVSAEPVYVRLPVVMLAGIGTAMAAITAFNFGEMLHVWTMLLVISAVSGIPAGLCSLLVWRASSRNTEAAHR